MPRRGRRNAEGERLVDVEELLGIEDGPDHVFKRGPSSSFVSLTSFQVGDRGEPLRLARAASERRQVDFIESILERAIGFARQTRGPPFVRREFRLNVVGIHHLQALR